MLKQRHFPYQRKNLYIPILGRIFSDEPYSDYNREIPLALDFFIPSSPDFILGSVVAAGDAVYKHIGYGTLLSEISGRMALMCREQEMLARLSL